MVPVVPVVVVPVVPPPPPVVFLTARPAALSSHHLPPKKFWPWPATDPALLSSLKRYSGWPLYVTWRWPLFRFVVEFQR